MSAIELVLRTHPIKLRFEDKEPERVGDAVWIQIAAEGEYKGHPSGDFELNGDVFAELLTNFRAHPSYRLDMATGLGCADVIPFDFGHASEAPAAVNAVSGTPAQAWAQDIGVRFSLAGAELWALTRYLEPARTYVKEDKYQFTSIAIWPNAVDPKTGKNIGWYMSSIAFTNDPFIQGMQPIAARRDGNLVPSTVKGTAATDLEKKNDDVAPPPNKELKVAMLTLLITLGSRVGIAVPADSDEAKQRFFAEKISDRIQLELSESEGVKAQLAALFKVMEVEDQEGMMAKIAGLIQGAADLEAAMPAIAALKEDTVKSMEEEEEEDVEEVMASRGWAPEVKPALMALRQGHAIDTSSGWDAFHASVAAKKAARKSFLERYPKPNPQEKKLLEQHTAPGSNDSPVAATPAMAVDLTAFDGRNPVEQAVCYFRSQAEKAGQTITFEDAHAKASLLVRQMRAAGKLR